MRVRAIAVITVGLIACPSGASEGVLYLALYSCFAVPVNETLVRTCSERQPDMAAHANAALLGWRSRYGEKAAEEARKCATQLNSPEISDEQRRRARAEAVEKWLGVIEYRASVKGATFCQTAIDQLEGRTGFDEKIWK